MAGEWYVVVEGKKRGPLTPSQLQQLAERGAITPVSQVSRGPDGPWVAASRVKGLLAAPAADPEPVTPPPRGIVRRGADSSPMPAIVPADSASGDEQFVWEGRPSQVVNLGDFIVCGLLCWLVLPLFVAVWRWLEVRCTRYEVTTQRFRVTHGVLNRRTDELELYRVKDTSFDQPLLLRMFSLANVLVASSDVSTPRTAIRGLPAEEARRLRETLRTCVERMRDRKRVREVDYN
jgi:membrane protein YdbS with pleckstrin-like domain